MVIPAHVPYREVKKIAFACNYYRKNLHVLVAVIRKLVNSSLYNTKASLSRGLFACFGY